MAYTLEDLINANRLFFPKSQQCKLQNFSALKRELEKALNEKDYDNARAIGDAAAVLYGASGLLLRHMAYYQFLIIDKAENLIVQTQGVNELGCLFLCKTLMENDALECENLRLRFPEKNIDDPEFWKKLENDIVTLCEIDAYIDEARSICTDVKKCYLTNPKL